jgi:hypothetical protein
MQTVRSSASALSILVAIAMPALLVGCSNGGAPESGGGAGADAGADGAGVVPGFGGEDASLGPADEAGAIEQPTTCAQAASSRSYVGCEFWPTVVFNPVYSVFDFAAVVANASAVPAEIKVERGGSQVATVTVAPGDAEPVFLPWVAELKGKDFDSCTGGARPTASVRVNHGAYRLTSSVPVTVWQFSPLEYKSGSGGPAGKNWACPYPPALCNGNGHDCLSVNNGATLLLPAPALTGNYRLFGQSSSTYGSAYPAETDQDSPGAYAITATRDGTNVTVSLVAGADVEAGSGVPATKGGSSLTFALDAGDVVQLLGTRGATYNAKDSDLSGSLVSADKPVQVIAFNAITDIPSPLQAGSGWADHLEETVLPAESLGNHYLVAPPTAPQGNTVGHYLRFYGNRDGTTLTYPSGGMPPGAPTTLDAGQVVDVAAPVNEPFEVRGSHELAIASIMMGSQIQDPSADPRGDPSLSFAVAVEQYRHQYIFLAPPDYEVSYADIVIPSGAHVALDGAPLTGAASPIGSSGWSVVRQLLAPAGKGAHRLESDKEVGLQIMGFGHATSYYTSGGLNLKLIAPPPPPPK